VKGCGGQEGLDGHLVRGIQGDAMRSALFRRIKASLGREALEIGRLEVQVLSAARLKVSVEAGRSG